MVYYIITSHVSVKTGVGWGGGAWYYQHCQRALTVFIVSAHVHIHADIKYKLKDTPIAPALLNVLLYQGCHTVR